MMESDRQKEENVDLSSVSAHVNQVHVDGLLRTKNDIVNHHVQPLFKAKTFAEVLEAVNLSMQKFEQLGLFKSTKVFIDVNKSDTNNLQAYDVHYKVKEQRLFRGGVSFYTGTNDGTTAGNIVSPNTLGRGEKVSADLFGSKRAMGLSLNVAKPLFFEPHYLFQTSVFQNSGAFPWSGFKLLDRGISVEYSFPSILGNHTIQWEGVWRQLSCTSDSTTFPIREESGHSIKSSIKHIWGRDTRDNRLLPNSGYLLKLTQEFAGLGGDAHFLKNEAEIQYNHPILWDSTLQLSLAGGIVNSLSPRGVGIPDRFFIGGPLTLRGFNFKGVGPRVDGCSLGATAFWCSGLHLYTPLPLMSRKNHYSKYIRTHLFANAGNLGAYDPVLSARENARELVSGFRFSYGAGIVFRVGQMARFELNYCIPVRSHPSDSIDPGFQFGFGVSFL